MTAPPDRPIAAVRPASPPGIGYDEVTGLGSINAYNLLAAWPPNSEGAPIGTTTTVSAANATPAINASDTFTITVTSNTGNTIPSGTISITIDGGTPIKGIDLTANGTATYTTSFSAAGTHRSSPHTRVTLLMQPQPELFPSTFQPLLPGTGSFALAATNVTVSQSNTGTSTLTVTPKSGYTGTVLLSFDTSNDSALQNLCYPFTNTASNGDGTVTVSDASAVSTQLSLDTNAADCLNSGTAAVVKGHMRPLSALHGMHTSGGNPPANSDPHRAPAALAFAGLLLAGFLGRYSRKLRNLAVVIALAAIGFGLSACGGIQNNNPPSGIYTITLTGQDSSSATIPTATTTFTFTIQ